MFPFAFASLCNSEVYYTGLVKELSLITCLDWSTFLRCSFLFLPFPSNQVSNTLTEKRAFVLVPAFKEDLQKTGEGGRTGLMARV